MPLALGVERCSGGGRCGRGAVAHGELLPGSRVPIHEGKRTRARGEGQEWESASERRIETAAGREIQRPAQGRRARDTEMTKLARRRPADVDAHYS